MKKLLAILIIAALIIGCKKKDVQKSSADIYTEMFVKCEGCIVEYESSITDGTQSIGAGSDEILGIFYGYNVVSLDVFGYSIKDTPMEVWIYQDSVNYYYDQADTIRFSMIK